MNPGFMRCSASTRVAFAAGLLLLTGCGPGRVSAPVSPPVTDLPNLTPIARQQRVSAPAGQAPASSAEPRPATRGGAAPVPAHTTPIPAAVAQNDVLDPRDVLEPLTVDTHWGTAAQPPALVEAGAVDEPVGWGVSSPGAMSTATYRPKGPLYTGVATYYGADFQGLPTAAGPLFDMRDPTVTASNSWPLGTRLRITRIAGGPWDSLLSQTEHSYYFHRVITVTVEDRGAFTHALDLSAAAFAQLGRPAEGVIRVLIESIDRVPPSRQ